MICFMTKCYKPNYNKDPDQHAHPIFVYLLLTLHKSLYGQTFVRQKLFSCCACRKCALYLTLWLPNFRRHLSSAFNFNKLSLGNKWKTECQTLQLLMRRHEPSHLDLCCLQKPIIIACGSERVNAWVAHSSNCWEAKISIQVTIFF